MFSFHIELVDSRRIEGIAAKGDGVGTNFATAREEMALQKKSFDDFIARLKDIVNKAP